MISQEPNPNLAPEIWRQIQKKMKNHFKGYNSPKSALRGLKPPLKCLENVFRTKKKKKLAKLTQKTIVYMFPSIAKVQCNK